MVGFRMILDSQEEEFATHKVQRFKNQVASSHTNLNDIDPPPYTGPLPPRKVASSSVVASREPVPPFTGSLASHLPQASVGQLHLVGKREPISGTFYIDPQIPSGAFHSKGDKARKKSPPHASFRTRHSPISLNLGTLGDTRITSLLKANVLVSSRHGNVKVNLLPAYPSQPTMGLEINTRHGDIVLFVPRDFSGVIQISSLKGGIEFLPAFASQMRIMKQSHKDALVMFGGQTMGEARDLNFCELKTRHGKVVIGLSDVDSYNSPPGFWKRLFGHSY